MVALLLVLVSGQGAGFLVHMLQLSGGDSDGCFPGLACGGGKSGDSADKWPIVLRNNPAAESKNHHDVSTCIICRQFLRSLKIHRASGPMLFTQLPIAREDISLFLDSYPSREIAPRNGRAPPLKSLI